MTMIPTPMLRHPLQDDAALVLHTLANADALHALVVANQARLARWEPWAVEPTRDGTLGFLEAAGRGWLEGTQLPLAIAVDVGEHWQLVGSIGLRIDRYSRSGDIGYWIDGSYEGRGLVTKGVAAVLDEAFGPLALGRVTLRIEVNNVRSRAVAGRLGFTEEGVQREAIAFADERRDQVLYGLLRADWR